MPKKSRGRGEETWRGLRWKVLDTLEAVYCHHSGLRGGPWGQGIGPSVVSAAVSRYTQNLHLKRYPERRNFRYRKEEARTRSVVI